MNEREQIAKTQLRGIPWTSFSGFYETSGRNNYETIGKVQVTQGSLGQGCTWPLRLALGRQLVPSPSIHCKDKLLGRRHQWQRYFPLQTSVCICVISTLAVTLARPCREVVALGLTNSVTSAGLLQAVRWCSALLVSGSWIAHTQKWQPLWLAYSRCLLT